jgi:hypothetical protein
MILEALDMRERPKVAGCDSDCERHNADREDRKHKPIDDAGAAWRESHEIATLPIGGRPRNHRVNRFSFPGHELGTPSLPANSTPAISRMLWPSPQAGSAPLDTPRWARLRLTPTGWRVATRRPDALPERRQPEHGASPRSASEERWLTKD